RAADTDRRARLGRARGRVWQTAGCQASAAEADEVDEELRCHAGRTAHDRAGFVQHAVAVRDGRDVVGYDRSHEVPMLIEDEIAWGVAALVELADRRARRRRELRANEPALAAESGRRDLDALPVGHADEAEVRVELDDDRLATLHETRELLGSRDVGRAGPHREPDRAEQDDVDRPGRNDRGDALLARRRQHDRHANDRRNRYHRDEEQKAEVVERPQRWNSSWMRRTAFSRSFSMTTSEMFSSLEP